MRLNPEKCAFSVQGGKFLGLLLTSGERNKVQKPAYFVSKSLQHAELGYLKIEKLTLALIFLTRRLRPYSQSHVINVRTEQSLRQVLTKPDLARRLIKWSIELSEFDIRYQSRGSIKSQYLTYFVTEFTALNSKDHSDE
ncbi:uncharacterized protein [Arachis hypogaea]|uniref:uncharacterized protein n=1 Tax=Arachis hypogaea TaxID=3818 RepID=UPI003B20C314